MTRWSLGGRLICCAFIALSIGCGSDKPAEVQGGGVGGDNGASGEAAMAAPELSQDLIEAALDAGELDYGTSLLYRAYASVNDPRLPAALRGQGSRDEDLSLAFEISAAGDSLSAEVNELLYPFTLRPTHPDSIFNTVPIQDHSPQALTQAAACPDAEPLLGGTSARRWTSVKSTYPVRVWFPCTGDAFDDQAAQDQADAMLAVIDKIWTPMTALMGEPILDEGGPQQGGDGSIDIYLADFFRSAERGIEETELPHGVKGAASFSPPSVGLAGSGYIVFPRWLTLSSDFHSVVIHEFFHVLQMAHNWNGLWRAEASGGYTSYWFFEASATWAMVHFDRTIGWPKREAKQILTGFYNGFQASHQSLHVPLPSAHGYEAFIWPYFMEQEAGDTSIAGAWQALEGVANWDAATDAVDGMLPFEDNFHVFAVRNVNLEFLPGDPLPVDARHVHTDKLFPDGHAPGDPPVKKLIADQPVTTPVELKSLSARYYTYDITDPAIQQVIVDFSSISPEADLDVDALIHVVNQGWVLRNYDGLGKVTFCFNNPDQHISELRLVLSDHAKGFNDKAEGHLVVEPLKAPCGCGRALEVKKWQATVGIEFITKDEGPSAAFTNSKASVRRVGDALFETDAQFPNPFQTLGTGLLRGTFTVSDSVEGFLAPRPEAEHHSILEGSGPPLNAPEGFVTVDGLPPYDSTLCSYGFGYNVAIETTLTYDEAPGSLEMNNVATLSMLQLPVNLGEPKPGVPIVLSGRAKVDVFDSEVGNQSSLAVHGLSAALADIQYTRGSTNPRIGQATVVWELTQVDPPSF